MAENDAPITIGLAMSVTGPLAPNGKQALAGARIWEDETNAKGGLLGRKVKLITYDDQSIPANVPGIYTKLLDVDKVDLVVSGYATNMVAPAMPVVMQKGKTFVALFGLDVNSEFHYPKYFSMLPTGPDTKAAYTEGFFQVRVAAEPEADDACDRFRRRRVRPQCLHRRARERQKVRRQYRLRQVVSARHDGFFADRPRVAGGQCRSCHCLLLSAELRRHRCNPPTS